MRLGDKPIPWAPTFKLFLTTKNPNPNFSVDTFVKATVINFAITPDGERQNDTGIALTASISGQVLPLLCTWFGSLHRAARLRCTFIGLEDQMLALVVSKEAPQLEEKKAALALSNAEMKRELKALQDKILHVMSQSQGNILEDEVLINTLAASKATSEEINKKVQEAEVTEGEIDEARWV